MPKKKTNPLLTPLICATLIAIISLSLFIGNELGITGFTTKTLKIDIRPLDRIKDSDIKFESNKVIIQGNFIKGIFVGSNSMLPVLFLNATSLSIIPSSPEEIYTGDIITFTNSERTLVVHRVIDIKEDKDGIYFVTKGDNTYVRDPYKVRFKDIKKVMVGVIW